MRKSHLNSTFLDLIGIDSETFKEGNLARYITERVEEWGFKVQVDGAGKVLGSDTGNLYIRIPGTSRGAPPLLLNAHLDTVSPGSRVRPVVNGEKVYSEGDTILGADCKSGIAIILDILKDVSEGKLKHCPLEVLFTIAEERGLLGIKNCDLSMLESKHALVLDGTGPAGVIVTSAPTQDNLEFLFKGRKSHAGTEPEKGINAIQGAAWGISLMRLGRIDGETTANIGIIEGGLATNIVPDLVVARGEVRSINPEKLDSQRSSMIRAALEAESAIGVGVEVKIERAYDGYVLPNTNPFILLIREAGKALGMKVQTSSSGGGSDANILNARGIRSVVMNTGAFNPHSEREYLNLAEFTRASRLCKEIIAIFHEIREE
jgi:tripeptide aminopeptidase